MKMARGSKKGRGRGAQESHPTQGYPYTPLSHSRYPTRSSRRVVPQLLASPPSGSIVHYSPLKSASRILRGDREIAEATLPSQSTGDVKPSIPTGSSNISGPISEHEMDLDGLCAKIASQVEEPHQVALQPASHQDLDGNTQPPRENFEVPRDEHALVHGHKVKIVFAHLVGAIFEKYGDITKECEDKSPSILSSFLECVCDVYHRLEKKTLHDLTFAEINVMRGELQLCANQKVNIGWLLEKLEQIFETKSSFQNKKHLVMERKAEKYIESNRRIAEYLEQLRIQIGLIQKNISALEQEIVVNEAEAKSFTNIANDIKTRAKALANKSLVHDLL